MASVAFSVPALPIISVPWPASALLRRRLRPCRFGCWFGLGPGLGSGSRLGGLRLRLLHLRFGDLHGRAHDHVAPLRAGHRAFNQQQLALGVDAHHGQAGDRAALVAEMARHALAGENVRRALVLASRAGHPVRDRVAVRSVLSAEMVALDDARKSLADGHALHVDLLADLEDLDAATGAA